MKKAAIDSVFRSRLAGLADIFVFAHERGRPEGFARPNREKVELSIYRILG